MIHRKRSSLVGGMLAVLFLAAPLASADVRLTGTYSPADNPRTAADFINDPNDPDFGKLEGNEGIQEFIEFTFAGFGVPPEALPQYTFEEGRGDAYWNIEIGSKTMVSGEDDRYGYGRMDLDGASILRYGHLVIGGSRADVNQEDNGEYVGNTLAEGHVTISGFGTVYNSSPDLVPSIYEYILATEEEASNDPDPRPTDEGFDVYVGLTGLGTLQILDGGRMEIGDSLQIGVATGSTGEVLVSGFGSSIDQRGVTQTANTTTQDTFGASLVGVSGTGKIRVENGGTFNARGGIGIGSIGIAIFGSGTSGAEIPNSQTADGDGDGTVEIDGASARLNAARGVTVAPFFDDPADYENGIGTGTLTVSNRGLVNIYRPLDEEGDLLTDTAGLMVGRNGQVELETQGRIVIADGLVNDGVVLGDGRIDMDTFTNRFGGRLRVGEGETLRLTVSGLVPLEAVDGFYYMANYGGVIEANGGEIDFRRSYVDALDVFINGVWVDPVTLGNTAGRITGQDATFRFQSGLLNFASLSFTAGDNVVDGDVENDATGSILLSGGAHAVFEDNLTNGGVIELGPDGLSASLTVLGDFTGLPASALSLSIGGNPAGSQVAGLSVGGDIALGGLLNVDLAANGFATDDIQVNDAFELISGAGALTGAFNILSLPALPNSWNWLIDTTNSDFTLIVSDIIPVGADFNGDGVVDALDLEIWRTNFGIEMGATGLLGDADLDGDVDGEDYLILLGQLGGAGMVVPGAITAGFQTGTAAVPEPTSIAMLAMAVAAGCLWRRR